MRAWTRAVAVLTALVLLASSAVGATCASACTRADGGVKAPVEGAAAHCARAERRDAAPRRAAAAGDGHSCGDHGRLAIDDARLPRIDAALLLPLATTTIAGALPVPTRLASGRHTGPAPPGPIRAPLVLRV